MASVRAKEPPHVRPLPESGRRIEAVLEALVLAEHVADRGLTPMSPAGTSVSRPTAGGSVMKDWQKRMTSASDLPLGSKSRRRRRHGQAGQGVLGSAQAELMID